MSGVPAYPRVPVLSWRALDTRELRKDRYSLRNPYAMYDTDRAYGATCLRACYAMCDTDRDLAYEATSC
eukprot:2578529-Rhodomonas_salina.2